MVPFWQTQPDYVHQVSRDENAYCITISLMTLLIFRPIPPQNDLLSHTFSWVTLSVLANTRRNMTTKSMKAGVPDTVLSESHLRPVPDWNCLCYLIPWEQPLSLLQQLLWWLIHKSELSIFSLFLVLKSFFKTRINLNKHVLYCHKIVAAQLFYCRFKWFLADKKLPAPALLTGVLLCYIHSN